MRCRCCWPVLLVLTPFNFYRLLFVPLPWSPNYINGYSNSFMNCLNHCRTRTITAPPPLWPHAWCETECCEMRWMRRITIERVFMWVSQASTRTSDRTAKRQTIHRKTAPHSRVIEVMYRCERSGGCVLNLNARTKEFNFVQQFIRMRCVRQFPL